MIHPNLPGTPRIEFTHEFTHEGARAILIQDAAQDASQNSGQSTAYDSVWAGTEIPVQESTGLEAVLLKEDKLYAVLAVVLIIWLGIVVYLFRTDRKIAQLERMLDQRIPDNES